MAGEGDKSERDGWKYREREIDKERMMMEERAKVLRFSNLFC